MHHLQQTVKPGDFDLTCGQLQNEYSDAQRYRVLGGVSHQAPVEEKSLSRHWLRRASLSFVALLFEMRS
jgi:hypothetical protein